MTRPCPNCRQTFDDRWERATHPCTVDWSRDDLPARDWSHVVDEDETDRGLARYEAVVYGEEL